MAQPHIADRPALPFVAHPGAAALEPPATIDVACAQPARRPPKLTRYLATLFLGTIAPLVALAVVLIYASASAERETVQKSMVDITRTLTSAVDSEIGRTMLALQVLAMSSALDKDNLDEFRRQAEDVKRLHGRWSNLGLVRADGTRMLNLRVPKGQPVPAGNDNDFLTTGLRGETLISNVSTSPTSGKQLVYVSVPVVRHGATRYVIAATMEYDLWTDWLRRQIPADAIAAIDDRNGRIVARSDRPELFAGRTAVDDLQRAYARSNDGVVKTVNGEGDALYIAYNTSAATGWHTLILMPAAAVDAQVQRYVTSLAGTALIVLGLAFLAALLVARPLRKATAQVKDAITSLGRGERPEPRTLPIAELDDTHRAAELAGELLRSAQRAVRNRTAQFEALLASAPMGAYLVDQNGRLSAINPAAEALFDAPERVSGEDFRDLVRRHWSANANDLLRTFDATLATGERGFIAELRDPARGRVFEWHMERLPLPSGGMGVVCYFRDVTSHVEARERLAESRAELQRVYDTAPIGLCVIDRELRFVRINRLLAEINGFPVEAHIGHTVRERLPLIADAVEPVLQRIFDTGEPVLDFELVGETAARPGEQRTWIEDWHPMKDAAGRVIAINVVTREVTEQRRAEEALRGSEERFRIALEASLMGFTILRAVRDERGTIADFEWLYLNPAAEAILRRPAAVLLGHRLRDVLPANASVVLFQAYVRVVETGAGQNLEVPYPEDGTRGALQSVSARLGDGVAVWLMDISERRRTTEELARRREELEATVTSLRIAQGQLQAADRQKDEFLAMLAHELRNPLTPIGNACELLSRLFPEQRDAQLMIGMIRRQVTQLTRLVDDLLDVSRITQGRIELKRETVDLGDVVAHAVETVEPTVREKRHALSIVSSYRHLYVNGDFARLVQCLVNVLNNAAKYTDPGGALCIETREDGTDAVVTVTDNGAGIPADLLAHVFDLFVQGDRTLDRAQGGLGIGLSVVQQLILQHGGRVVARSEGPGRGSSFELRLPLVAPPVPNAARGAAPKCAPKRVLVVDDNADAADSLAMVLSLEGHVVDVVYDGASALARIPTFDPEVVFLDIGLPQLDGYEVARRIRALPGGEAVTLVAVTGYGQVEDVERARAAGFDHHIVKPVEMHAVLAALADPAPAA